MAGNEWVIDGLPDEYQQHLRAYVKDVQRVYGDVLEGLLLYGSAVRGEFLPGRSNLNIVLVVQSIKAEQLKKYSALHRRWAKEQIVVPLFVTQGDLPAMSLVFPLEYLELQEYHRLLAGQDPFVGFKVDQRHLLAEVLQSLRGNLLRVRQRFIEGGGAEEAVTILLPLSLTAVLPALRGVQRLVGRPVLSHGEPLLADIEALLSIDLSGLRDAWLLKRGQISPGQKEIPRLMERYLESFERLVQSVEARQMQGQA
ncbi:MAG: hypothetical protein LZF86_250016 [Nitrospira sp.]|nr:MAG: hypothetical protein LZF86_250016 [Nitrospira sp.]